MNKFNIPVIQAGSNTYKYTNYIIYFISKYDYSKSYARSINNKIFGILIINQ